MVHSRPRRSWISATRGKTEVVPQNDPDSLKLAPNGDLLLASGSDQVIIDVCTMPEPRTNLSPSPGCRGCRLKSELDDVLKVDAHAGTFYISDTADNRVLAVHATDLNTNDYFASIGNAFGAVDPTTGKFTALVSANNAPGFKFGSAHGAAFVADQSSVPAALDASRDGFVFPSSSRFDGSFRQPRLARHRGTCPARSRAFAVRERRAGGRAKQFARRHA